MESKTIIMALSALAQESRLAIYRLLVQAGPAGLTAGRISDLTGIPPSSLSFHFKELAHAGLVSSRQDGRFVIYSANFATMNKVLAYLAENCCEGASCVPLCTPAQEAGQAKDTVAQDPAAIGHETPQPGRQHED